MIIEIAKIFFETFLSEVFKKTGDYFKEIFGKQAELNISICKSTLESQFGEVVNWCTRLEFIGLEAPKSIEHETIPLTISNRLRKFGSKSNKEITEEQILVDRENYIIVGDPGAGKTTTLKRITQKFLFCETGSTQKYPVLIRLKEIQTGTLLRKIADTLGLAVEIKIEVVGRREKVIRHYIGSQLIENAIPSFLDSISVFLLLDGYDEINLDIKDSVKNDIKLLSRKSTNYKIVLTSRHGEDFNTLEGFTFSELQELNGGQIVEMCKNWCTNHSLFLDDIYKRPYHEIANRPLFLNFLILHFNKLGYLPNASHEVVKQIIHLLLEDWNKFQGVKRLSKYADFYPPQKFDFLSNIAFQISFEKKVKQFKHSDLITIYNDICYKYNVKKEEADEVAQEIESHTGIIIKLYNDNYEFSHLVLQEYLAAEFVIKQPFSNKIFELFNIYPAILALATCISSDSGRYFSNIFLNTKFADKESAIKEQVVVYLKRLQSENIFFTKSVELGMAVIYLFKKFEKQKEIISIINELVKDENVFYSIEIAVTWYHYKDEKAETEIIELQKNHGLFTEQQITIPDKAAITNKFKKYLIKKGINLAKTN
jgi:hypothetical protein